MTQNQMIVIGVCLTAAVLFGPWVARVSLRKDTIYGGFPSKFFNLLGAMFFVTILPGVIAGFIVGNGFAVIIPALITAFVSFLCFLAFAFVEKTPRENALKAQQDRGWTEKDARTSGL